MHEQDPRKFVRESDVPIQHSDYYPEVFLPNTLVEKRELVQSANLSAIPPVIDAISLTPGIEYVPVTTDIFPSLYFQDQQDSSPEVELDEQGLQIAKSGLILALGMDLNNLDDTERQKMRQVQRLGQFKRLTGIIDTWERNLDGSLTPDQEEPTRSLFHTYKRIAVLWYTDELSAEPFTKRSAEGILDDRLPTIKDALTTAERDIKSRSLNVSDILRETDEIIHPIPEKIPDSELINKLDKPKKKNTDQLKKSDIAEDKSKLSEMVSKDLRDGMEYIEKATNIQQSGILYVYDKALDEPSKEAAEYMNELWDRKF